MKALLLILATFLSAISFSFAQAQQTTIVPTEAPVRFMVALSEYQLDGDLPATASEADVLEAIREKNVQPTETIRLSVINDVEGMIQFGKLATITVGKTVNRDVTTRQTQNVQVGTLLKLTVSLENDLIVAAIAFEASKLSGEGTDDSPPEIASTTIKTTQLLNFERPCLIGSSSGDKASYVFITIAQIP